MDPQTAREAAVEREKAEAIRERDELDPHSRHWSHFLVVRESGREEWVIDERAGDVASQELHVIFQREHIDLTSDERLHKLSELKWEKSLAPDRIRVLDAAIREACANWDLLLPSVDRAADLMDGLTVEEKSSIDQRELFIRRTKENDAYLDRRQRLQAIGKLEAELYFTRREIQAKKANLSECKRRREEYQARLKEKMAASEDQNMSVELVLRIGKPPKPPKPSEFL